MRPPPMWTTSFWGSVPPLSTVLALVLPLAALRAQATDPPAAAAPASSAPAESRVETTRTALEKWMQTRELISREKRDWASGREVLATRIEVVKREIEALRQRIADGDKSLAESEKAKAELTQRKQGLDEAASALKAAVADLEGRTVTLLPRLPEPLRERVKPFAQRIPTDQEATDLRLGERFASVVAVLNEAAKFQREITVTSEVRQLPDGTSAEVKTMYLGLGQAYYVTPAGNLAGVGTAGANGWVWSLANEHAAAIANAIAIFQGEATATFVPLPVSIQSATR